MDNNMTNQLSAEQFKSFFRKNRILGDEPSLNLLCSLYPGQTEGKVSYVRFLLDLELIDELTAQTFLRKTEKTVEQTAFEEFASFVELMCRKQGIDILQIFDLCDKDHKGYITFSEFKYLATQARNDGSYGEIEIERLFSYADSNNSQRITKDEFYRVILSKHYSNLLQSMYASYMRDFDQIRTALKNLRKRDLKDFFQTDQDFVSDELFMRESRNLGYDERSDSLYKIIQAFQDGEVKNKIDIKKVLICYIASKTY